MSMFLGVAVLAAAATTPTQCQPLPPGAPAGSVMYQVQAGDTPYAIANQIYGDGYQQYIIIGANLTRRNAQGGFTPGTWIVLPPDQSGRPVKTYKLPEKHY
jgi:hypothetical protein